MLKRRGRTWGDNAVFFFIAHYSLTFVHVPLAENYGAIVRGQWSVDPVAGDVGVMMKILTGELRPSQAKAQNVVV